MTELTILGINHDTRADEHLQAHAAESGWGDVAVLRNEIVRDGETLREAVTQKRARYWFALAYDGKGGAHVAGPHLIKNRIVKQAIAMSREGDRDTEAAILAGTKGGAA